MTDLTSVESRLRAILAPYRETLSELEALTARAIPRHPELIRSALEANWRQ